MLHFSTDESTGCDFKLKTLDAPLGVARLVARQCYDSRFTIGISDFRKNLEQIYNSPPEGAGFSNQQQAASGCHLGRRLQCPLGQTESQARGSHNYRRRSLRI
jgi:hypothetical protein